MTTEPEPTTRKLSHWIDRIALSVAIAGVLLVGGAWVASYQATWQKGRSIGDHYVHVVFLRKPPSLGWGQPGLDWGGVEYSWDKPPDTIVEFSFRDGVFDANGVLRKPISWLPKDGHSS